MKLREFNDKYGDYEIKDVEELKSMLGLKGRWKPEMREVYYFINAQNTITGKAWDDDKVDEFYYKLNRIYKTKEECEKYLEIHKAFEEASVEPNWGSGRRKCYLACDYNGSHIDVLETFYCHRGIMIYYFDNEETLENLIKQFEEDDIKKYVLGIYD